MKIRLTQKNVSSPGGRPWRGRAALVGLVALGVGGWWRLQTPPPQTPVTGTPLPSKAESREALRESREARRLADLVERGAAAIPLAEAATDGPPVPARVPERRLIGSGWKTDPEPAMADFAAWVTAYLESESVAREGLEAEGVALATARLKALEGQIAGDPRRALANAIPLAVREQLPESVRGLLESRVDGFGDLATLYTTALPGEPAVAPTDRASIDGHFYEAYRYGDRTSVPTLTDASLHGIAVGERMAVLDSPLRMLETGEKLEGEVVNDYCPVSNKTVAASGQGVVKADDDTLFQIGDGLYGTCEPAHVSQVESALVSTEKQARQTGKTLEEVGLHVLCVPKAMALGDSAVAGATGYIGRPPTSLTHGGKNVLIMRVQPNDRTFPAGGTVASFNDMAFGSSGWDTRMRRTSYNKTWLNRADITPIMTLPRPASYYVSGPGYASGYDCARWIDDSRAAAIALGYNMADYACLLVAHDYYPMGAGGLAWGGHIFLNSYFGVEVIVHEYGHTFWLPHANSWYATDGNPISAGRQHREYGDANDPMGNAYGVNQYNTYNAYYKNFCGWMPDSSVQTVTRNGTYRVYQDDGSTDLNRTLALKLGRDHEFNYWISVRGDAIAQSNFNNGVAVMAVSSWKASDSHLLDLNNPGDDNRDNAPLAVNQTWYDSAADLTLKTVAVGGSNPNRYADVQITFGPRNVGAYRPLVSGGVYRLRNRHNGQYLDVPGNTANNATPVQIAAASGTASQNWVVWRESDGSYRLNHQGTDKWLDVQYNSASDGAEIWQYTSSTGDSQRWYVSQNADGYLALGHKSSSGKILEMDVNTGDIHQMGSFETAWQQWYPELVGMSAGTYRLLPRHAQGQCLDIAGGGNSDGTGAILYQWNASPNQQWGLSEIDSGRIRLTPQSANTKALDISGSGTANGTRIQQWNWFSTTNAAQRWTFSRTDGNWLRFTPDCAPSGCMEVSGDDNQYGNDSVVQLWQFTGALDQQWRFADSDP